MSKQNKLKVKSVDISIISRDKDDYISLTDIAKYKNKKATGLIISHWLSRRYSIEFMGIWEQIHNPDFNVTEFGNIKNESGSNAFILSSSRWIDNTKAIGLISQSGRYGGTYAHKDIAFEFASWISPEFKLYLIKEFQRLKELEIKREKLDWDFKRNLAKVNYKIHTDAIKKNLIPPAVSKKESQVIYASEADVLNKALFGMTAQEWRKKDPKQKGNIRDYATASQLVCLSNLESLNATFMDKGLKQSERLLELNKIAISQMKSLIDFQTNKILNPKQIKE